MIGLTAFTPYNSYTYIHNSNNGLTRWSPRFIVCPSFHYTECPADLGSFPTHRSSNYTPIPIIYHRQIPIYSLAPQLKSSFSGFYKALKPLANAFANASGYRQIGLRYDDILIEEREDVQKVSLGIDNIPGGKDLGRAWMLRPIQSGDCPIWSSIRTEDGTGGLMA